MDAYKLIEQAELENDSARQSELFQRAIEVLSLVTEKTADTFYALGYSWYRLADTEQRLAEAERYLMLALEVEPFHLYARLYLAHVYFDSRRYALALPLFAAVRGKFTSKGQGWRDVKSAELILACHIYVGDPGPVAAAIQDLLESCCALSPDELPNASELGTALRDLLSVKTREIMNALTKQVR